MAACLFEMKSLSVTYGADLILQDVDFRVYENDFVGVIGPNGGGKTTLLKAKNRGWYSARMMIPTTI